MTNGNSIEEELNAIRIAFFEEIKDMSASEMTAYIRDQIDPIHEKFGVKTVTADELFERTR